MSIRRLSNQDAIQIGSSQVIISVKQAIKELIENALDAQATTIEIRLEDYGRKVTVIDNGLGIHPDNFDKIGKRSHTSKIEKIEDVETINTFGYRGEALNSLCCTCDVNIITATDPPMGTKLQFERNGQIKSSTPIARSQGTTVCLENIFSNLPVRRQEFNRNAKKDFPKIIDLCYSFCLAIPNVKISLSNQTKGSKATLVESSGQGSRLSVFTSILGPKGSKDLMEFANNERQISFTGIISSPQGLNGRADKDRQFTFVNNIPVYLPVVSKAINQKFREYNSQQFPAFTLFLKLANDKFDRNMTPDKLTIMIQDDDSIVECLLATLHSIFEPTRGRFSQSSIVKPMAVRQTTSTYITPSKRKIPNTDYQKLIGRHSDTVIKVNLDSIRQNMRKKPKMKMSFKVSAESLIDAPFQVNKEDFVQLKVIGQFNLGFILASLRDSLLIIDQHASDEKFLYEKYSHSQILFTRPKKLVLTPQQEYLVQERLDEFKSHGFLLKTINDSWYLAGIPQIRNIMLGSLDFEEILGKLSSSPKMPICSRLQRFYASKACRSAVMIGDALTPIKMREIVNNMGTMIQPWNCPHGRPTMRILTKIIEI